MGKRDHRGSVARFFRRTALVFFTVVVLLLIGAYTLLGTVFTGPSPLARDALTVCLMQDPATDWIPGLYLDADLISRICQQGAPYAQ